MKKGEHVLQRNYAVIGLALLCCLLWSSAFPGIKTGYVLFQIAENDAASQIFFAGIRFTLAGVLVVAIYSIASRRLIMPRKASWGMIGIVASLQTVLQYFFFYIGLAHTTGVKASIIESSSVFIAILFAALLFHQETMTKEKTLGCVIGFAGVVLVNLSDTSQLGGGFAFNGEGFLLIACVAYALSSVFIKIFSQKESPVVISGYQFILGGLVMTVAGLVMGGRMMPVNGQAFLLLFYLAMVSAVAYSVWGLLLKYNPVSRISIFTFSSPLFGVALSVIFLKEGTSVPWGQSLAAMMLVSLGIYLVNKEKQYHNNI
ncbi:MAG: DMT family transporter [Firmicutes bacterium]|nr:DMT family transporter [Bacillota bacterium]